MKSSKKINKLKKSEIELYKNIQTIIFSINFFKYNVNGSKIYLMGKVLTKTIKHFHDKSKVWIFSVSKDHIQTKSYDFTENLIILFVMFKKKYIFKC